MVLEERWELHLNSHSETSFLIFILCLEAERRACKLLNLPNCMFLGHMNKQVSVLMVLAHISRDLHKIVNLLILLTC